MSKKRARSGQGSASVQKWEQNILSSPYVEEDKWNSTVSLVIGNKLEDYEHINILSSAVSSGQRRLFSIITKDELYEQVKDLGNPKSNKKGKEIPANFEICEPCRVYLENGEDLPLPLLAKLLKFKLLDIKQKDLKRRENEKKGASDAGKPGKKDKKDRSKSPAKGKGGKKTPEPPSPKEGTKLKKRGEEDTDSKYIDDEPDDGPQHYVLISGFHYPHMISLMGEVGICIDSIIKVTSENYARFERIVSPSDELVEKDEKTLAIEDEAQKKRAKEDKELHHFWRDTLPLLRMAPEGSRLHDVARLEYTVQDSIIPESLEEAEAKVKFGTDMFELLACMVYDLLDSKRQWRNWLENLQLFHVQQSGQPSTREQESQSQPPPTPGVTKSEAPKDATSQGESKSDLPSSDVDMRYYNELMNAVPQESASIPLIMHCMLEQVVATDEDKEPPSETPRAPRADGLDDTVAKHVSAMAFRLALSEEEAQELSKDFDAPKLPEALPKQPLLINYHDDITRRLNHLKGVDSFTPMQSELEMLGYLPMSSVSDFATPTNKKLKEHAGRLQEMLHFCVTGELTPAEVDHAFHQFVAECVNLRSVDDEAHVQPLPSCPQQDIPWDDPYPFFRDMVPVPQDEEEEAYKHMSRLDSEMGPSCDAIDISMIDDDIALGESACGSERKPKHGARTPDVQLECNTSPVNADVEECVTPPGSRPGSGILKQRPASATSRKSFSTPSVHFERGPEGVLVPQPGDDNGHQDEDVDMLEPAAGQETMDDEELGLAINDVEKRNLDQWCFAEHMDSKVLLQVMMKAIYTHPFMDTYYHRRDDSLLVVLHNPYSEQLQSRVDWHCELHSNVGFRNYLEHISDGICDWTREQEAKHQAILLSQEVEKITKEAEEASSRPVSAKDKKRDRSKSPKKSPSRSGKSPSRSSSAERPSSSNPYVRQGSLKAWKEDQDRARAEEDEKEKQKNDKRARSAQKKASKEQVDEKESKKDKRPGSRSSSKSKQSKEDVGQEQPKEPEEPKEPERYWPFSGYDMGNSLLHAKGEITTLFPADGGQIRMEKTEFIQGTVSVKTSLLKDGHNFTVHVLDPKLPGEDLEEEVSEIGVSEIISEDPQKSIEKVDDVKTEKDGLEGVTPGPEGDLSLNLPSDGAAPHTPTPRAPKKPCVGCFGSFSAQYNNGLCLSLSTYGSTGQPEDGKKYQPAPYQPPVMRSPTPSAREKDTARTKKGDKGKDKTATPEPVPPQQDEEVKEEDVKVEEVVVDQPFQQLNVTSPDGLCVTYLLESSTGVAPSADERRLMVKQVYPFKTRGLQDCESTRKLAMEEQSRVINSEGTVIKTLVDGTLQVLFANGTVSQFVQSSPLIPSSRSASPQRGGSAKSDRETPTKKKDRHSRKSAHKKADAAAEAAVVEEPQVETGYWITTAPSGERVATTMDDNKVEVKDALISVATDPASRQSVHTREDHVVTVYHPDGTTIVEHGDGTRITTFFRKVPAVPDPMAEETAEGTAEMETRQVQLVQVECPGFATVRFDTTTSECSTEFGSGTIINTFPEGSYDVYHCDGSYLQVEADGTALYHPRPNNDLEVTDPNQQLKYTLRHFTDVICETIDNQGNNFVVRNNGETEVTCTQTGEILEAVDEALDEEMQKDAESEKSMLKKVTKKVIHYKQHAPRFFIVHHDGTGTELLRYHDVAEYIAEAEDDPATAILMDPLPDHPGVIGITVLKPYLQDISRKWIKHYEMETVMPPGLTSRDLLNWPTQEQKDENIKFGTNVGQGLGVGSVIKNPPKLPVIKCPNILELRQLLQYRPISEDLRDKLGSSLRQYAEHVKAHNLHSEALQVHDPRSEEEKMLAADLQGSNIPSTDISVRTTSRLDGDVKGMYEQYTAVPEPPPPPAPQPKRSKADWERDERELAEEQEARRALKDHDVPPYFDSELGKSFLLSQAPDMTSLSKELCGDQREVTVGAVHTSDSQNMTHNPAEPAPQGTPAHHADVTVGQVPAAEGDVAPPNSSEGSLGSQAAPTTLQDSPSPIHGVTGNTPTALRPGNPTPFHAGGEGSPVPLRPGNPTPAHAVHTTHMDRPGAPTPKQAAPATGPASSGSPSSHVYPTIPEHPKQENPTEEELPASIDRPNRLTTNMVGEPRRRPVRVPAYTNSGRPGFIPNSRFLMTEDPVRRRVNTSSVTGATPKGNQILNRMRGFELLPSVVNFGVLREGTTYNTQVHLKNTGVDSCRFKIRQPPPSTSVKVIYKPGPVAAGMKAELSLEIYAVAVGVEGGRGAGQISHNLEIITETDHLYLPITAIILTAHDYDTRPPGCPEGGRAPGVVVISHKPPSSQGIIRPRKEYRAEPILVRH